MTKYELLPWTVPDSLLSDTPLPQELKNGDDVGALEDAYIQALVLIRKNNAERQEVRRLLEEAKKLRNNEVAHGSNN